ncbi:MAG TPA: metallophosphoesterase [Phycicoccus sp.]|nr:metallophosphoesterase [Phycicoccus sp.]HQK31868.1 metallophosphoesterase [Phycicoccus sp.]HQV91263.1 metallophosphoesterase [Phycicoccus sp.]HRA46093.1 metallophosphoesterase [Phycicoccus sp.]
MFFVIALSVLLGGLAWLTHRLAFAPGWGSRWVRIGVPVVLVVLTGLTFLQFGAGPTFLSADTARPVVWVGAVWLALALYLILALIPVAFVSWLTGLSPKTDHRSWRQRIHRVGVPVAVLVALIVTGLGVASANDPKVVQRTFTAKDLPADFDGVKVALLADLHVGPTRSAAFTTEVVKRVNATNPDLVVIAGDLVDGPEWRYGPAIDPLKGLKAPLGVFAVTGNHETYSGTMAAWEARFERAGVQMLDNKRLAVLKGASRIWLMGVRDYGGTGEFAPDYEKPLARVETADFALLLAHQPRSAMLMQGGRVDLQVSGHTHGGQLWPFRQLVLMQQPMVDGLAQVGDIPVVTTRGAGTWGPPVRVGASPQIPIITLKKG